MTRPARRDGARAPAGGDAPGWRGPAEDRIFLWGLTMVQRAMRVPRGADTHDLRENPDAMDDPVLQRISLPAVRGEHRS